MSLSTAFAMKNRDPTTRLPPCGRCIYCGSTKYREKDDRELGEEHIIAESLGGSLVLGLAACHDCERRVNDFEQPILKTILYAPRVHLGIRRKRRRRGQETIKVQGVIDGRDVTIDLPIKNVPVLLFLLRLGPPGILVDRPQDSADMQGAWINHLSGAPVPHGFQSFASPVLDTYKFCQFLAKIAHSYAIGVLGDQFEPLLIDLIRTEPKSAGYHLVGGIRDDTPSNNLHELELASSQVKGINYLLVKIRLFANLGAPTYLVVAGTTRPDSGR